MKPNIFLINSDDDEGFFSSDFFLSLQLTNNFPINKNYQEKKQKNW